MSEHDVCIIGFGPTGAVAASLLADAGHSVVVVDRLGEVYDRPRAIALDHEIMRVFQNLGVIEAVLPHIAVYPASEYRGASGDVIKRLDAAPPPFSQSWAPNYSFTQPPVERALRDRARAAGASILLDHELVSLTQDGDGVRVRLTDTGGSDVDLTAKYVIGADGAASTVRRLTGLVLDDLGFDEPWLVVDVRVGDAALGKLPDVNVQYCEPARPSTYVIGPGNHRRWEIMLTDEDPRARMGELDVWSLLARWIGPEDATLWRSATYRFHAVVAREWRSGRVFLAGDAAHQQPPFLGQGMCQGVRDAANLAWKLDLVLRGGASPDLLESYGEERRDHVVKLTTVIKRLGRFICERDPYRARARDEDELTATGGRVVTTFRQDIMPPLDAGLLSRDRHPGCGLLFPQPRLTGDALLDEVLGGGFRLFLAESGAPMPPVEYAVPGLRIARIVQSPPAGATPGDVAILVEQDAVATRWFSERGAVAALVRPDNYVYGIAVDASGITRLIEECHRHLSGNHA